ncbi:MAG: 16S rRNA (cytosine(1402)-N(4))-methyltransferase RsmH, partial [Conexibacter sp.]
AEQRFGEFAAETASSTRFVRGNCADVLPQLREEGIKPDLIYMDLGISSLQVDTRERGFSYSYDAPLDMRMDPGTELDARAIVNEWPQERLTAVFREYGEERYARQIAREIVRRRERASIDSTTELVAAIKQAVPIPAQFGSGHPARRVFQALRIAVNDEIGSLERALPEAWSLLAVGGRMAVISFHSLEDRPVKRFFADRARGCICPPEIPVCVCGHEPEADPITRRVVRPSAGEVANNPRSRAGRLRATRKLREPDGNPPSNELRRSGR